MLITADDAMSIRLHDRGKHLKRVEDGDRSDVEQTGSDDANVERRHDARRSCRSRRHDTDRWRRRRRGHARRRPRAKTTQTADTQTQPQFEPATSAGVVLSETRQPAPQVLYSAGWVQVSFVSCAARAAQRWLT